MKKKRTRAQIIANTQSIIDMCLKLREEQPLESKTAICIEVALKHDCSLENVDRILRKNNINILN